MEFEKNELVKVIIENGDEISTLFGLQFLEYPEHIKKKIVDAVIAHLKDLNFKD